MIFNGILDPVIPWYYYVPREGIDNERNEPYSVRRIPASEYSYIIPFLTFL